jgi:hypothetical protein
MTDFEWSRPGMAIRSGAELHTARKAAAERYARVAYNHTPSDVVVTYRKGLSGRAWVKSRKISVPEPTTRRRLQIYLHEVAHVVLNHTNKKPRHLEELEAEQWSFRVMRAEGIPVPRKSVQRAKSYVRYKIKQAKRRGAKKIDAAAARFAFGLKSCRVPPMSSMRTGLVGGLVA